MEQKDNKLESLINNLNERNKELNCLYKVDDLFKNTEQPLENLLKDLMDIIPYGFRYSDICAIKINYGELEVASSRFKDTALKMQVPITVEDKPQGHITVVYTKTIKSEKGIFLTEEHKLLKTIAEKLGNFILYQQMRASLEQLSQENQFSDANKTQSRQKLVNWLYEYNLTKDEVEKLTQFKVNFKKGETICKQGAITSYVMLLAEGLTKNYLEGNQEKGFNFKIVTPFDFIGLTSLYGNNRYLFSGTALTPSTIYMIEKPVIKEIIGNNPDFAAGIMGWFSRTTEYHLKRLSCIANKQSLGRISEILLYLMEDVFSSEFIPSSISRKDIAELAGMSTESAVRMLSELKKDEIISVTNRGIQIQNVHLLKTLSMAG
jgi:CRP/FNR family transcriptional regulator